MKALNRAIERFCQKHRRFGIQRLMLYIVVISAGVFIISMMDTTGMLLPLLQFSPARILRGEIWRLVTWVFCPLNDNILFTALMLYFYYFIGSTLEREWGTSKFTLYYILGIILNVVYGFLVWLVADDALKMFLDNYYLFTGLNWLAPSYLNLSMFFAFAVLFPEQRILLFFFIPVKIKWLAWVDAALFLYTVISQLVVGEVFMALIPIVAVLNFAIVCWDDITRHTRLFRSRRSAGTINFKAAAKQAKREQEHKQYRHKCSVCGRTDIDDANLEFRYCSRCNGYHCFCLDHINNHVHFR